MQQPRALHNRAGGTPRSTPRQQIGGGGGSSLQLPSASVTAERHACTPKSYTPKSACTPTACPIINARQIYQASNLTSTIHSHGSELYGSPPEQHEQQTLFTSPATSYRGTPCPTCKTLLTSPATSHRGSPSPTCTGLSDSVALNRGTSGQETLQAGKIMADDSWIRQPVTHQPLVRRNQRLRKGNRRSEEILRSSN